MILKGAIIKNYQNINGNRLIAEYEIGKDFIKVKFYDTGHIVKFSYRSAGINHVEKMKVLAEMGAGLGNYIETKMVIR